MTDEEVRAFVAEQRIVTCATMGPNGRPHLMPLWFTGDDSSVVCWTYAASQKARNLQRLNQATLQFEAGVSYEELRGVMMECDAQSSSDPQRVVEAGMAIVLRYAPPDVDVDRPPPELVAMVERQAPKRVVISFTPTRTVSWDHRKLGGTY